MTKNRSSLIPLAAAALVACAREKPPPPPVDRARQRSDVQLRVEGNCDERGTTEYTLALGRRRADAAKKYVLVTTGGVAP